MQDNKKLYSLKKKISIITLSVIAFFILIFTITLCVRVYTLSNPKAEELSKLDEARFENICTTKYHQEIISPLYWDSPSKDLTIGAESSIMINIDNGDILFEKNADEIIPPASMTKLVVMYVVFQEIASGKISMDDIVPLPPESWAKNAPLHSSLMFLDQGQTVTLHELLLGLAVSSGNDAAIAIAHYVSGSVDDFVARMNKEIKDLGLTKTHFVEPSGYDEHNITTAREFATFARTYVTRYPQALTDFHSVKSFTYPKQNNLASWHKNDGNNHSITQYNTNKALGVIEGVNGLKTGFIYESGYNISITAERNGTKLLTVSLRGPGSNSTEGNMWRIKDAQTMLESAFSSIRTVSHPKLSPLTHPVIKGKESAVIVREAWVEPFTIPYNKEASSQPELTREIHITPVSAPLEIGEKIGTETYKAGNMVIAEIPLVSDRKIETANLFIQMIDSIAVKLVK
ncbi:MAG: hypothetical protein BKP49_00795 [Treponema sp. CETP13]|nr:MAG: hypothetical protein BKP49_00795 [Treponema sp. CETP13]